MTGPMGRRVLKFDGAFGPEGCGGGFAAGCVEGLCKKVLRFDRPLGRRVLKFDGPFWPESCGIALTGDKFCMPPKAAGLSLLRSRILFSDVCRLIV